LPPLGPVGHHISACALSHVLPTFLCHLATVPDPCMDSISLLLSWVCHCSLSSCLPYSLSLLPRCRLPHLLSLHTNIFLFLPHYLAHCCCAFICTSSSLLSYRLILLLLSLRTSSSLACHSGLSFYPAFLCSLIFCGCGSCHVCVLGLYLVCCMVKIALCLMDSAMVWSGDGCSCVPWISHPCGLLNLCLLSVLPSPLLSLSISPLHSLPV